MRKLMWFAIGFGSAIGLCVYLLWNGNMWLASALMLAAAGAAALGRKRPCLRIAGLVLLGCAAGFGWFGTVRQAYLLPATDLDGQTVPAVITASQYSEQSLYGTSVDGMIRWDGRTYRIRVYLKGEQTLSPGDRMEGNFRIRLTTPEGKKESSYYQGKGIFLIGSQTGELELHSAQKRELRFLPAILARRVRTILREALPEDVFPFAQALLLGDASGLDYSTDTALRVSGIRHIIAVSGLHVAILYGLVALLTGNRRYLTAVVGLPVLLLFAAMAGFTPSVSRASIMIGLMMISRMLNREYDAATELSFACLLILTVNPFAVASVSFQLSVLSVAGILLFQPGIMKKLGKSGNRWERWLNGTISLTLSATLLSAPLSAYYFGTVSLIGVLTNVLVVWVVGIVFYGILAVCALGAFWMPGAAFLGMILAVPIRYVLTVAALMARIPLAAVYTKSAFVVAWLAGCYVLLAGYLVIRKGKLRICGAAATVGLFLAVALSWYLPRRDDCRLTVLDVGQGQSLILQSGGHSFLVDCGGYSDTGAADTAAETLLSQGIFRLDGILLTHYDRDHMSGIPYLLTRVDAARIYLPEPDERGFGAQLAGISRGEILFAENLEKIPLGSGQITLFVSETGKDDNENSVGILFETEECAILCTGDRNFSGENELLEYVSHADVLIAGHHGSKYSTGDALLDAVQPETVIISAGAGNSYGHPAPETLRRLEEHGCTILRTDELGTILYRG